jgi:uncharacterized protein
MNKQAKINRPARLRAGASALCVLVVLPLFPAPVFAQESERPRTLMDMLFGGRNREMRDGRQLREEPQRVRRPPARERSVSRPQTPRTTPSVTQMRTNAPAAPVTKLENARRVLVVGDFLASGMGDELTKTFASSPAIAVDVRANGSSGLVRADYYDWLSNLPNFIQEVKPAAVVIMLGSNDRQLMMIGDLREKYGTELWFKEYERRIDALATIVSRQKIPLLWVGLPAFQSPSLTTDFVGFNRLYRNHTEKHGGEFVDVWDGFVDEGGKFIITGYDVNGQQARLREADGIGMTQAGKRKLAFSVEKFLRRHVDTAAPEPTDLNASNLPALASLPALGIDAGQVRTQPISLTDPELDGGNALLGDKPAPATLRETPRELLIKRGEMADAPLGRVDDYRMPTPDTATTQ